MAKQRTKRTAVIEAKPYTAGSDWVGSVQDEDATTIGERLAQRVRAVAEAYTTGDQTPPAAILWPDGDRRWAGVLAELKTLIPELYVLGDFAPTDKTGPAIWLRCVEARTVPEHPASGQAPIFYLPGVSRQALRAVEESPVELDPLIELQFRGAVWSHPNGRDWTPFAFLTSTYGGLGLDVADTADTSVALDRSLAVLLNERIASLAGSRLDAPFLNALLSPDLPAEILRWMNDPAEARKRKPDSEWQAFCAQCAADFHLHPETDGELRAAELMGNRSGEWDKVWKRFTEAPNRYPAVAVLLERASPATDGMLGLDREVWPCFNTQDEADVAKVLLALKDSHSEQAAAAVLELEKKHGCRRGWVWRELGRAPLAVALEHLSLLATLTRKALAAADATGIAEQFTQSGWEADAAAIAALAGGTAPGTDDAIATAVRALYLPWVDQSARNLQRFAAQAPTCIQPRLEPATPADGRVILFVDGLRFDLAQRLSRLLHTMGSPSELQWDWAAFPSVTATGKAAVSPMATVLTGGGPEEEFAPCGSENGHRWNADRFHAFLKAQAIQCLQGRLCGDPAGRAWAETGALDSRGHNEGVKAAKTLDQEVRNIATRIRELLDAGWREIVVVTDHGWLLVPGGLPKVELSHYVVENRWGRCAAIKAAGATDLPTLPWYWNPSVTVATPPGVGCFRAGVEYAHGGLSLQEMVIPRLTVRAGMTANNQSKISGIKWVNQRCRLSVQNALPGLQADIRSRPADARSSKVEGGQPREIGTDGTVSLIVGDDREAGNAAVIVLLSPDGTPIHTIPTVIGENG